jgi:hypothetical protein
MKLKMIFNFITMNDQIIPSAIQPPKDGRCLCGNLLARLRPEGVELKCRRCKRVMVIPWGDPATWHGVTLQWQPARYEGIE